MQVSRTMFEKLTSTSSFLERKLSENLESIPVLVLEKLYKLEKIYIYIYNRVNFTYYRLEILINKWFFV